MRFITAQPKYRKPAQAGPPSSTRASAIVGLDPGLKGGIAILSDSISVHPMPVDERGVDVQKLFALLPQSPTHVFIEEPFLLTVQGARSALTIGVNFGRILGVLEYGKHAYARIHPLIWQRAVGITKNGNTKAQSVSLCQRLYPHVPLIPERCRVPHDGIADALLIAHYGKALLWKVS